MTAAACKVMREHVLKFMSGLPGPDAASDEEVVMREDGVREFGRSWSVYRGPNDTSLMARLSDRDDVIEFGLLLRAGDASVSLLHATLVLDADDILLNVISEADMDLNFDAKLDESKMDRLQKALDFYAEHVNSYASAETR